MWFRYRNKDKEREGLSRAVRIQMESCKVHFPTSLSNSSKQSQKVNWSNRWIDTGKETLDRLAKTAAEKERGTQVETKLLFTAFCIMSTLFPFSFCHSVRGCESLITWIRDVVCVCCICISFVYHFFIFGIRISAWLLFLQAAAVKAAAEAGEEEKASQPKLTKPFGLRIALGFPVNVWWFFDVLDFTLFTHSIWLNPCVQCVWMCLMCGAIADHSFLVSG